MSLFVDSSAWYAAVDKSDANHARATAVLSAEEDLVTSDHVLIETWQLLRHRLGRTQAEQYWEALRSGAAEIESVLAADLEIAWGISERFREHDFSIVDRTSFAVMLRLGIRRAASFDDDFAVFRFGPGRRQAFEIVR
jgi:predicted nucleic acid-binding protein